MLSGAVTEAVGGVWTGGAGTFTPDDSTLTATYSPTAAEMLAGSVTLILTTYGNGGCPGTSDTVIITYQDPPVVDAGTDIALCEGDLASLSGSVTGGAGTGIWTSTGSGSFSPSDTDLSADYTPSAADVTAGTVTLTLTATDGCAASTDFLIVTITEAIVVDAGPDDTICIGDLASLAGSVTGGTSTGIWTTSGSGSFSPADTDLSADYTPSAADELAGSITIYLTSTTNGACAAEVDSMVITITTLPIVDAGGDAAICEGELVSLAGSVTGGGGTGIWTTSGSGTFSPSDTDLSADYTPSAADVTAGTVTITLTATASCSPVSDFMIITITPDILVDAGADEIICEGDVVSLSGSVTGGTTTGIWTTSGSGSFSPSDTDLSADYTPSAADILAGSVTITLTSTANGACSPVVDFLVVTITTLPIVDAGGDVAICEGEIVSLSGSVTGASTTGIWTTSGSGTFSPSDTDLSADYTPSAADILAGSVTLTLSATGSCAPISDFLIVTITSEILVDAGVDDTICIGDIASLTGSVTGGTSTGIWTTSGSGAFSPSDTDLSADYTPSAADETAGTVTLFLTSTANGACSPVVDSVIITITSLPIVDAGGDVAICEGEVVSLGGTVTGGAGTGIWTTSGSGTFSPSDTDLSADYTPSAADILAGSVTLTLTATDACLGVTDDMIITITPEIIVDAGPDQVICMGDIATLAGSVTGGTSTGIWTTSGSGSFSPSDTDLGADYTPSAADELAGTVTIYLTSTANGACAAEVDSMVITITEVPVVDAGADIAICEGDLVSLSGTVTGGAGTGIWTTSGSGTFSPSDTDLGADYTPSAADILAGTVTLTLSGDPSCAPSSDFLIVTITPAIFVNAGLDDTICIGDVASLTGSVSGGTTTGIWTTSGSGSFSPSDTDLSADYTPSAADELAGTVTLYLTSTANGACAAVVDSVVIIIQPTPIVDAGSDVAICEGETVTLAGSVTGGAGTGIWTTSGSGTFSPIDTDLGATYTPSAADILAGTVTLTLTSTGSCAIISDDMIITITPEILVDAGSDVIICTGDIVTLAGSVSGGTSTGIWSTSGTGSFSPSDTDLGADYTPSAADELAGSVTIYLTSTANGACSPVVDSLVITITPAPIVDAGSDTTICSNDFATLAGSVSGSSTTGIWSTSGDGTFSPIDTDLGATYTPGVADTTAGIVTIYLTSTASCVVVDSLVITIISGPFVDAGPDQVICISDSTVDLDGLVSGSTSTGIWTTTGSGTFSPNDSTLNATYNLSTADSTSGTFMLILTSTNNGGCPADVDTMIVTMTTIPVVDAGVDTSFCANNMGFLDGTITGGASTGIWTTSGSGTFLPTATTIDATYDPSDADTTAGVVILTLTSTGACVDISDDVTITITPGPIVDAGLDTSLCETDSLGLAGLVSGASFTGIWTSSGDGTFSPSDTDLNAFYSPGPADVIAGTFDLYLAATGIGDCLPEEDTLTVILEPVPIVDGGGNQTVCSGSSVSLSGTISGGVGGSWSSLGTGTFTGGGLSTTYDPSTADTTAGSVDLVLTSDPTACGTITDTVTIFFVDVPSVDAGFDVTVCANNDSIALVGITTSGEGVWSTSGDGVFSPDDSLVMTTYIPGTADEIAGTVELILSTINGVGCPIVTDTLIVTITPAPVVDAGPDISVCAISMLVPLSGSVTGGSSTGVWTTLGSGTFSPDDVTLTADYIPSTADTTAGTVTIVLTSTFNGDCEPETDTLIVTFEDAPIIDAGADAIICQSDTAFFLGTFPGGGSIEWTTSGTGTFVDSSANPGAYLASADDTLVPIEIYATYTNSCGTITDTLVATVLPSPNLNVSFVIDCETFEVAFDATTSSGIVDSIYWDFGDGGSDTIASPTHTYASEGSYAVTVTVMTEDGCTDLAALTVTIDTMPIADFNVSDTVVMIGDTIEFTDSSLYATSWIWDFGDLTGLYYVQDTTYSYDAAGDYTVILIVTNGSGCADSTSKIITVQDNSTVWPPVVPNAFTPNGDGLNDLLFVRGGPFSSFDFRIYNEWGNEIFRANDQSEGWDGTYKSKKQPVGVYIYLFEGTDIDGIEYSISSDFSLIR